MRDTRKELVLRRMERAASKRQRKRLAAIRAKRALAPVSDEERRAAWAIAWEVSR